MTSTYINPLDFKKIFLDYFLGSLELFTFAFIIVISFASAKMGLSNRVFMVVLALSSLIFGYYLGNVIYVFVLFLIGYISFKSIARIVT